MAACSALCNILLHSNVHSNVLILYIQQLGSCCGHKHHHRQQHSNNQHAAAAATAWCVGGVVWCVVQQTTTGTVSTAITQTKTALDGAGIIKNALFGPFLYKNDHFAKTGSGQT